MFRITILYFEGCPNHLPAVELAEGIVSELGIDAEITEVEVSGPEDAQRLRFLGSPSIQINGVDVDPSARNRTEFGFSCRTYSGRGLPSREMLSAAILGSGEPADSEHGEAYRALARNPVPADSSRGQHQMYFTSVGALAASVFASACCWLPLLLISFGASAGGAVIVFEKSRPLFLMLSVVLLIFGYYVVYVRRPNCAPGIACADAYSRVGRRNRAVLWLATAGVVVFAAFPLYVGGFVDESEAAPNTAETVVHETEIRVSGMTCAGCSVTLGTALSKVDGVERATVDYDRQLAVIGTASEDSEIVDSAIAAISALGFTGTPVDHTLKSDRVGALNRLDANEEKEVEP